MRSRGSRIALGQSAQHDDAGHSLPSDVFMHFVALEVAWLGTWAVETREPRFDSRQVHERGNNTAVQVEEILEGDGRYRRRFKMSTPWITNPRRGWSWGHAGVASE